MTRRDQALRWWRNHAAPGEWLWNDLIPLRHQKVLLKAGLVEYKWVGGYALKWRLKDAALGS